MATNQAALITQQLLDKVRVLIISRHLLARLYKINWSYEKGVERNASGRWVSRWCRKPNKALHPIWSKKWDLLGVSFDTRARRAPPRLHPPTLATLSKQVDEAHLCRNPATEWAVSHNQLSSGVDLGNGARAGGCKKRVALTATPVFNRPLDCVGLCVAIDAPPEFQDRKFWSLDRACKTINPASVRLWQRHTDRVTDAILNLPPIHQEFHDFDPALPEKEVVNYNDYVCRAKQLRTRIESGVSSSGGAGDLQKLMLLLQRMQQMLVSPKLAHVGAEHFKKNPAAVAAAAMVETGALLALFERIVALQAEGHERIIVAVGHTQLMAVARRYLVDKSFKKEASIGTILVYDGSLTLQQRQLERNAFMSAERAVLFLSIGAGGTGLHLVPQNVNTPKAGFCRSVVFWGSRPYSPQQVWQTLKRVHRIGAMHEVFVHHIIARGSVDDAINHVHKDKSALAAAVVDDDFSNCDEASGCWKRAGKIVSHCREILESGEFAMEDAAESPAEAKAPVAPTSAPLAALGRDVALPIGRTLSAPPPNMLLMQRLQPAHSSPLLLQQPAPPSRYFSMAQARTMVPKVAPPPAALARLLAPAAPSARPPPPTAASRVLQRSVPVPAVAALVFGTPIITTTPSSPPYLAVSAARSMAAPVVTGM